MGIGVWVVGLLVLGDMDTGDTVLGAIGTARGFGYWVYRYSKGYGYLGYGYMGIGGMGTVRGYGIF